MSESPATSASRLLIIIAAFVVVMAGLRAAAPILLPVLVSIFFAILAAPAVLGMERRRIPATLAVGIAMVGLMAGMLLFAAVLTTSMRGFDEALPGYQQALGEHWDALHDASHQLPFDIGRSAAFDELDPKTIVDVMSSLVSTTLAALSNTVLVLITVVFMLLEVAGLPRKLRLAMDDPQASLGDWSRAVREVQRYLTIKTAVSLMTGLTIGVWLWLLGVDFPILWGLVAFLLNFIPNVGSIIAAIPALLLAVIQPGLGFGTVLAVGLGYAAVNTVLGNMLEPQWMGRRLGLSPLVVFLSLLFWGFLWGPVGMLLAVPLTTVVRIVAEHWDDTHWLVVLLGPALELENSPPGTGLGPPPEVIPPLAETRDDGPRDDDEAPDAEGPRVVVPGPATRSDDDAT